MTATDYVVDRSRFPAGPWDSEPDKEVWIDEATQLDCMVIRNRSGCWCGYVGVSPGHPFHGASYDDPEVDVHGGLTYADSCDGHICHVPVTGRPDDVWWFGFDCHHAGDLSPGSIKFDLEFRAAHPEFADVVDRDTYRTIEYAKVETRRLAAQLAAMS